MASGNATQDLPSKTNQLLYSWIFLTIVGTTFVLARFYARFFKSKAHGWDDYFLGVAMISGIVTFALVVVGCSHGYGTSIYQLDPAEAAHALKAFNFTILTNGICMILLKLSIGASLLRLQLGRGMNWIVWLSIFISVCANAMTLIGSCFQCVPMEAIWNIRLPNYTCIPKKYVVGSSYAQACGNIVTDIFFSLSPLYYLRNVRVSVYNKWALRVLFCIGLSASACSIAKLPELGKLANTTDPTYAGPDISIWAAAEFNAGLVASSMPPLKSMFESTLKFIFGIKTGSLNSSAKRAYQGAKSSLKSSRINTRHSQHQILPEESQADIALISSFKLRLVDRLVCRDGVVSGSSYGARTSIRHKNVNEERRELRKRGNKEKECESTVDEEDDTKDKDKTDDASPPAKPTKSKSKCSRQLPPPIEIPIEPPPLPSEPPIATLDDGALGGIPILSVSAFPTMTTEAVTTTGISIAATTTATSITTTATTLTLNAPTIIPSTLPSGTQKSGAQAVQASAHAKLSPHAKNALIAFGIIMGIALTGFLLFTTLRCLKRKRSEPSAYDDLETLYKSDPKSEITQTRLSESENIAIPSEAHIISSPASPQFYLPPLFRTSQRPWSGSLWRQSMTGQQGMEGDPFADLTFEGDAGRDLFMAPGFDGGKVVVRKEVGGGVREDPFRDPEKVESERRDGVERVGPT
ncbi:hypothetical protein EG328_002849 [Venturia inaequalis]|uniref:Rhodopsin domain-containing protein n=1 Tax=Venturia inaequalis TaxID=5025 RepID=A0A8H3UUT0_VENIN|nr:hypothetical protein EG328_002849 [Venturia inaequalis]